MTGTANAASTSASTSSGTSESSTNEFTNEEVQLCRMARAFSGEVIAAGATLLSSMATVLAKSLYDDDLVLIGESWGVFDCDPAPMTSNGEWLMRSSARGNVDWSLCFDFIGADMLSIFVGPPQIDRSGSTNLSVIGDWRQPKIQMIGSRGLPDDLWRCSTIHYHVPTHTPRSVVDTVDFVSAFGYGDRRTQYPTAKGKPGLLVTDLGVFTWPEGGGDMIVESLHPGVTVDQVKASTGFDIKVSDDVAVTAPPTADELRMLRRIDPFDYRNGSALIPLGQQVGESVAAGLIPRPWLDPEAR